MNKITQTVLAFLVVGLLVACSGLTDEQYVEKALSYLDDGELVAASIELKNALKQNPENAQARWLLGKLNLEIGNAAAAEKELRRAGDLGLVDGSILPYLARALLAQEKNDDLQKLFLDNLTTNDQKATVLAAQGLGMLAQGDLGIAEKKTDFAISLDPKSVYALVAKARVLVAQREYEKARWQLDRVIALESTYAPAWSLLGDLEKQEENFEKAEEAYTQAVENRTHNLLDLLKRAQVRVGMQRYVQAQQDLDTLKQRIPQNAVVNHLQGVILLQDGKVLEAQQAFETALHADPQYLPSVYVLALTHLRQANIEAAGIYAQQFVSVAPDAIAGRKLLSTIEIANQNFDVAEEQIRPVVIFDGEDVAALNLLASALIGKGNADEAVDPLEKVASLRPESAVAQLRLGAVLLATGEQERGIGQIRKALELDPGLQQAYMLLVTNYLGLKQYSKALEAAQAYRAKKPESATSYALLGRIYQAMEDKEEARSAFLQALEFVPGDPSSSHSLAAMAIREKQYADARAYYRGVLEHNKNHLSTLMRLAALDGLEDNENSMVERLQQAVTAHHTAVQPRVVLARHYLARSKPEQVATLFSELTAKQKNIPAVLSVIAQSELAQRQYIEAKLSLVRLLKLKPDSASAHFLLARSYAGLKDSQRMVSELETSVELAPDYFVARLALARGLLLRGDREKAKGQMVKLEEMAPENPDVLRLKAKLSRLEGEQVAAAGLYQEIFDSSPTTGSMLALAQQKWIMGDRNNAVEMQEKWVAEHPDDLTAALALGSAYSTENKNDIATSQFQQVLAKDEENVVALNELAWHLRDSNPKQALLYAKRANVIAPESTMVLDTLAVLLSKNGDTTLAKRQIGRVLEKEPNNPTFRYHSAMIDAEAGDRDAALKMLEELIREDEKFSERTEADELYQKLRFGG